MRPNKHPVLFSPPLSVKTTTFNAPNIEKCRWFLKCFPVILQSFAIYSYLSSASEEIWTNTALSRGQEKLSHKHGSACYE